MAPTPTIGAMDGRAAALRTEQRGAVQSTATAQHAQKASDSEFPPGVRRFCMSRAFRQLLNPARAERIQTEPWPVGEHMPGRSSTQQRSVPMPYPPPPRPSTITPPFTFLSLPSILALKSTIVHIVICVTLTVKDKKPTYQEVTQCPREMR